jgi:S-adenosyl-L-methionine hydrolase (adenosine-forming)
MPLITLSTDFGTADGYVGEMKGVILSDAPGSTIVDITHEIEPEDVDSARLLVERCWQRYPPGTVHVVVVDPGVGSVRAAIAVESCRQFLVGPDNGVLSAALLEPDARVVSLRVPPEASATFHGRDVFAPTAARLASGAPLSDVGAPHATPVIHHDPEPVVLQNGNVAGEVVHADRFGNALTNLKAAYTTGRTMVEVAGRELPLVRTYADVAPGQALGLVGSSGRVEIAIRNGHAARVLGLARGARVIIT